MKPKGAGHSSINFAADQSRLCGPHAAELRILRCTSGLAGIFGRNLLLMVCLVTTGSLLRAADARFTLPPETVQLRPGPGVELVNAQCALCHSLDYISTQPRLTRAQWEASLQKMQQKYGAPVPADTVPRLLDYLVKNYGAEKPESTK